MMILSTLTNRSKISNPKMKTKTTNKNTSQWNVGRKSTPINNILKDVLSFNHVKIITAGIKNKNNKLKGLFQSINNKKGETNTIDLPR